MITIKQADKTNFFSDSLDDFDRFQKVCSVFRIENDNMVLYHKPFAENWSEARKKEKALQILSGEYITFCAFDDKRVVGEIMLVPKLAQNRMIVDSFHVSREYRRHGIGRKLFERAGQEATTRGAEALYISACSAEETIRFYLAMGCTVSDNPIASLAEDEPFDIQMEFSLRPQDRISKRI